MNLTNEKPRISDNWIGGASAVCRILGGIDRKTLSRYSVGSINGGIDFQQGKRGRLYTGAAVKRLWELLWLGRAPVCL